MKVKVQCNCGSKFEFEVEPVQGRMPVSLNCPSCGQDATEAANTVIASQTGTPGAPSALRIHIAKPATAKPSAPVAEAAPAAAPGIQECAKHPHEGIVQACHVCGKPMCRVCMEHLGNVCSVYCRQQAEARGIDIPVFAGQKSVREAKARGLVKLAVIGAFLLVFSLIGFWVWYSFFARDPKVVYTVAFTKNDPDSSAPFVEPGDYHLIAPGKVLCISNDTVTLRDLKLDQQLWSSTIPAPSEAHRRLFFDKDSLDYTKFNLITTSNEIWINGGDNLARLDLATGAVKDIPVKGLFLKVIPGKDSFDVITGTEGQEETVSRISTANAEVQSEVLLAKKIVAPAIKKPTAEQAKANEVLAKLATMVAPKNKKPVTADEIAAAYAEAEAPVLIESGPTLTQMRVTLVERKIEEHVAIKPKKNPTSIIDSAKLTASQGMEAAEEMMNESQRDATGGVDREDVSTYEINLHRVFAKDVQDWKGQVNGPARLTSLKTIDVLTAGHGVYVFDKQNHKLWESKLTYPASSEYGSVSVPMVETSDSLYLADKGNITRFDLSNGNVRWRFTTVRTEHILYDPKLGLYVVSSTASPDTLQYGQQIKLGQKIHTQMIRLDPDSGKALWKKEASGDQLFITDKFLYAKRVNLVTVELELEDGPQAHFYATLLNLKDGDPIWTYHRGKQRDADMEVQKNWVLLQFKDKLVVLKFFTL